MSDSPAKSSRAPAPAATSLLGHARAFRRDPPAFLLETAERCGPVARLHIGPLTYHLVSEPALIAEVLQHRAHSYIRDTRSSRSIRLVTGESLLTSEGETWRRHRRLAQPVFHQQRLAQLGQIMATAALETAAKWETAARSGESLDLASEMSRLTFAAVGRCLFGVDLGERGATVESALPVLLAELFHRAQHPVTFPLWLPWPRHQRFKRALTDIHNVVGAIVRARSQQAQPSTDLLGLLLEARDESGGRLDADDLRNQIVTFLLAGHETTASLVTWTLALLAQHPAEQRKLEEEVDRVRNAGEGSVNVEAVMRLPRLDAVLQETLRLYPSIWIAERRVVADDELGGFAIGRGTSVIVSPYVTQRLPLHWPDAGLFRPDRFLDGVPRTLAGHGFFPFGAGPHVCIGQHFALMEARIIVATLVARFRLRLESGAMPAAVGGITLRPPGRVGVRVERRAE